VCGDGTADIGEDCDGTDLTGETCRSQGFDGGRLTCNADCSFNTRGCTSRTCGDGTVNGTEDCDGSDLDGGTCTGLGFDSGRLACAGDCSYDTSGCVTFTCGDGTINGIEDCDGTMLGGENCISQGFTGGTLACNAGSCTFNTAGCGTEECTDAVDNDFDTQADCADADCTAACADACNTVPTLADPSTVDGDTTGHADLYDGACEIGDGGEVIYSFTPAVTGSVVIGLSSASDQGISAWTACGTGELGCADRFFGGTDEALIVAGTAGTPVFVQVEAFGAGSEGPYTLDVTSSSCGNGVVDAGEACDDGNVDPNDGCSATCVIECGDGACGPNENFCGCPADCANVATACDGACECGSFNPPGNSCACDDLCIEFGDCCSNETSACGTQNVTFNLVGNTPVPITDGGYNGTLTSMGCMQIPTPAIGTIVSVNSVQVTASMTFIGDLTFKLVSPSGTVVTLMSRPGGAEVADNGADNPAGSGDDLVSGFPITFSQSATVSAENMGAAPGTIICQTAAPGDGICNYVPNPGAALPGDLNSFTGQSPTGTWQFCTGDSFPADVPTVSNVVINLTIAG